MARTAAPFDSPPITHKADGSPRMVGFELEFSGLTLDRAADAVRSALGGAVTSESAAEKTVRVEALGDFKVELDWDYLKRLAVRHSEADDGGEWIDNLSDAAAILVPVEVVCPPIAIGKLDSLQPMVAMLREAGALGTEESLLAAYGVHINPEIPRLEAATLVAYLTAFALLQWWLVETHDVDMSRKVSPYIGLYAEAYVMCLISNPMAGMEQIFADYLAHNPTRNRAMDLLPLLAEIDEDRVRQTVDDPKIKARPTFHYRMPNCHIERADWSLARPWNTWCVVERLVGRPNDLHDLGVAFQEASRPVLGVNRSDWVAHVDRWLKGRALA